MNHAQPTHPLAPNLFFRPGVMEVLACGVTALVYVATLSFGFVYDDVPQILNNPAIHDWHFVPQYFTSHVWAAIYPNTSGNYYRPLFLLWLKLNYALFGTHAAGWHLTSVACHVLATWLVFRIAQQLSGDRMAAFIAALIFGVHPTHVENVAWISGVSDPLMACFLLGSFSAFLNFREARRTSIEESYEPRATSPEQSHGEHGGFGLLESRISKLVAGLPARQVWYEAPSLGLFALALLSKETAIVLPILIIAFVLIFERDDEGSAGLAWRFVSAIRESAPYLLLVVIYGVVRYRALGGWSHPTIPIGWSAVFLTWPAVLWFYARHLVLPLRLSEFYSLDYVSRFRAAAVLLPLVFLLIIAVAVAFVLFLIRGDSEKRSQKNTVRFALVLLIVPLLPVLDLHSLTVGDIVHDRYLYLPCAGFALLIALLIRELAQRLPQRQRAILPAALATIVGVTFAALTVVQQMQWASDILLYTRGLESAPANLTVRDNLASALLKANQPARAIPLYLEVLSRNPDFWRSNYNLGFAYYKTVQFQAAEYYLQRAVRINPADSDQYIYLALAQLELKKFTEAAENASRAIARSPNTRGYHFVLGLIFEAAGDRARAAAEFKTEIVEHPENTAASAELQKLNGVSSAQRP